MTTVLQLGGSETTDFQGFTPILGENDPILNSCLAGFVELQPGGATRLGMP